MSLGVNFVDNLRIAHLIWKSQNPLFVFLKEDGRRCTAVVVVAVVVIEVDDDRS